MNKADLFTPRLPEAEFVTPAGPIKVRGLSRAEVIELKKYTDDPEEVDARFLELGVVDPKLSREEIEQWRHAWPNEDIEKVTTKIAELSGMRTTAEAVERSFPGE